MTIVITGASSGIGAAAAAEFSSRGHKVYSLSRSAPTDTRIEHIKCDISDKAAVTAAFDTFFSKESRIDMLVNNAGIGISGASELTPVEDMKKIFDTNFFGAVYCTQCVTPKMREQKYGRIVFISSVGAVFTLPFQTFYSATKQALNTFAEGAAMELKPFGIKVGTIMPGDISSNFTANRKKNTDGEEFYKNRINKSVSAMEKDESHGASSARAGKMIAKYLLKRNLKLHKVIGFKYKLFCLLNKFLPRKTVIALLAKMYG